MVEGNDLVEEHQVHVPEVLLLRIRQIQLRLTVFNVVVGEVAHQAAGKWGKPFQYRTFVILQNFPESFTRVGDFSDFYCFRCVCVSCSSRSGLLCPCPGPCLRCPPEGQLPVRQIQFQGGMTAQEGIPPPAFRLAGALQQVTVAAGSP